MAEEQTLKRAVETAWTLYLHRHDDVDPADGRRCLLERHLQRSGETREIDADELTYTGINYLERLPPDDE